MSPSHLHVVANGGETERPEASRPERGKNRVRRRPVLDGLHDTRHVGGRREADDFQHDRDTALIPTLRKIEREALSGNHRLASVQRHRC